MKTPTHKNNKQKEKITPQEGKKLKTKSTTHNDGYNDEYYPRLFELFQNPGGQNLERDHPSIKNPIDDQNQTPKSQGTESSADYPSK